MTGVRTTSGASETPHGDMLAHGLAGAVGHWSMSDEHIQAYARDASPLALKAALLGQSTELPLAVAWPSSTDEVAAVIRLASRLGVAVIPYGGGSGIVGGAPADRPAIVLDMKRMRRIRSIDAHALTLTVEAGAIGALVEEELGHLGLTTGHYPQSLYSSTIGGWIAHRGVGTYSSLYGRIEDILLGLEVVLPDGEVLTTRAVPASAAGPDLKRLFLGAEGTFGVVTAAVLQIRRRAPASAALAFTLPTFEQGLDLARHVVQAGYRPAVARIYDPIETAEQFRAIASDTGIALALFMLEGPEPIVAATRAGIAAIADADGATVVDGEAVSRHWLQHRFSTLGLCETLQARGGVADALEVAADWSRIAGTYARMKDAMSAAAGVGGRVYGHASHVYPAGTNVYMIFHAFAGSDEEVPALYRRVLRAAMDACLESGGTITHHHGVGTLKAPWMARELEPAGIDLLARLKRSIDPGGVLAPGRLGVVA